MRTNNKRYTKISFWATILVVQFVLFFILSKSEWTISIFEKFFELQKNLHQKLFAWIPFSLGDLIYILLGIFLLYLTLSLFKKSQRKFAIVRILITLNVFYFLYQIFWGILYFQKPLISKLSKEEITISEAKQLALQYLHKCNTTRELVSEDNNGVFHIYNLSEIESEVLNQQKNIPSFLNVKENTQTNSIKPSFYGKLMNYSGILGYYNPFTAEAQYNEHLPHTYLPFTIAHESSHQLGYAREQEANFIGYLIGVDSKNLELRYSTEYATLKSLLNYIVNDDPKFVENILKQYSTKMQRDRKFERTFIEAHQSPVDDFFAFTNNLFLKSNQQEGSITYSYFIDLLIRYERKTKESYQ